MGARFWAFSICSLCIRRMKNDWSKHYTIRQQWRMNMKDYWNLSVWYVHCWTFLVRCFLGHYICLSARRSLTAQRTGMPRPPEVTMYKAIKYMFWFFLLGLFTCNIFVSFLFENPSELAILIPLYVCHAVRLYFPLSFYSLINSY